MIETLPPPGWTPDDGTIAAANVTRFMARVGVADFAELHRWSVERRAEFWSAAISDLGIVFADPYRSVVTGEGDPERVQWLPGARLNIAASCFPHDPTETAVVVRRGGAIHRISSGRLHQIVTRFANGFRAAGLAPGDPVAIAMPMTVEAVAAYLGIVWAGGVVVSIADSFAAEEIETRLRITGTGTVVTQDRLVRGGKSLPMYEKVVAAGAERAIVISSGGGVALRPQDVTWDDFLGDSTPVSPVVCEPDDAANVLFSSGTTGDPKAIAWTHLTPIKAAMDGRYHQDIRTTDVVAWPTNLGWMIGPWLIFASLVNGATIALYDDAPTSPGFARFVQDAGVTILGVVPSLVATWRANGTLADVDWTGLRLFSSTGEASNAADMAWLMDVAGGKPVIEYCGGTELGGGYLTGTVVQAAVPSTFTTPALGVDIVLLDEQAQRTTSGEVFLVPPSIGMSQRLLNRDHHEVYFAGVPEWGGLVLRRHGDRIEALEGGYYRAQGRIDDTMNLGGIKVSSAEIERVAGRVDGVAELAAIAVSPAGGGPSRLVIFAVPEPGTDADPSRWQCAMQDEIDAHLNPLFKIHEVVVRDALPRTASAKVMRRRLREDCTR